MAWLHKLWNTLRSRSLQNELDEELRFHLEQRTREMERSGMSPEEARTAAKQQLGNITLQTERMRTMDVAGWLESVLNDLRYALRQFRRSPVFAGVAVLSLALGIGANAAIFSVMNQVLLKALPVHDPQELVSLTNPDDAGSWTGTADGERTIISYPEFLELRQRLTTLSGLCAAQSWLPRWQVRISGGPQETVRGRLVSEEYFSLFGINSAIGRVFKAEDAAGPGQDPYAVISYDFWQRRFGGRPDVIGAAVKLNKAELTIIGVAERGFKGESGGENPDLWIPVLMQPWIDPARDWLHEDPAHSIQKTIWMHAYGRMRPGVILQQVQAEASVVFKGMMEAFYPPTLSQKQKKEALSQYLVVHDARTGSFDGRDEYATQLKILLSIAGLVLLIACANVANLLLARATARNREVGVRLAIGASRARLFRQFFTESLLLCMLGGAAGLALAWYGAKVLVRLLSDPQTPLDLPFALDWRVLGFTIMVTLFTGILFGMVPSLRASRTNMTQGMREGNVETASGRHFSLAKGLVVAQVGISLLLVVGSALFLCTLRNLQAVPLGYPKEHLLQVGVQGAIAGYKDQQLATFFRDIAERIRALPGVLGVTYSELGLMTGGESNVDVEAEGFIPDSDENREARFDRIGPGYFDTVGIPLLLGRSFGAQDTPTSPRVCIVNEELARRFFAGRNPIGRHLTATFRGQKVQLEIVGVVKDARTRSLQAKIPQRFYLWVDQGAEGRFPISIIYEIRTAGDPIGLDTSVRKTVAEVNPDAPVSFATSMEEVIDDHTVFVRMIARLSTIFASLALLLAATGLYGVLSYGIARRTNEIGIRMALGADRLSVVGMILRETGILVALGLTVGLIAALLSTRLIATQLYGVSQFDPVSFAASAALLATVGLFAGYIPAARAARVDPVRALRHD
ncbi:MAG TPA: ABC transporter permease [Candidatus Angelobacter sp.]